MLNFEAGDRLRAAAHLIGEATIAREYAQRPHLLDLYGESGRTRCREDILHNLTALSAAIDADDARMFLSYVGWLRSCWSIAASLPMTWRKACAV